MVDPKKAAADIKKPAALAAAATSAATVIVEAARTAETTQVDSGATALLAAAAVLVSPPPSSQTQPLVQDAANTGPTGTPNASPAAGTQRYSSGHFRPAGACGDVQMPHPASPLPPPRCCSLQKTLQKKSHFAKISIWSVLEKLMFEWARVSFGILSKSNVTHQFWKH